MSYVAALGIVRQLLPFHTRVLVCVAATRPSAGEDTRLFVKSDHEPMSCQSSSCRR